MMYCEKCNKFMKDMNFKFQVDHAVTAMIDSDHTLIEKSFNEHINEVLDN